jgi:hypothetical protein
MNREYKRTELADSTRPHDVGLTFPQKGDDLPIKNLPSLKSNECMWYDDILI